MVPAVRSTVHYVDSGYLWGQTSYAKVEMFGKSREQWLKKYIKLENGIPDACTFRNVIKAIDTRQLHTVFVEWMRNAVENVTGIVAIDGKQARRTKDARKPPLHVVSAFSAECSLVLGQLACGEKSNEITAIPKLLDMLELKGCIVTIDAMGTQTEIAKKIREKGADYILSLKENQKTLYEDARLFFEEYRKAPAGLDADCCAQAIARDTEGMKAESAISAKTLDGWTAAKNGAVWLESASFFVK